MARSTAWYRSWSVPAMSRWTRSYRPSPIVPRPVLAGTSERCPLPTWSARWPSGSDPVREVPVRLSSLRPNRVELHKWAQPLTPAFEQFFDPATKDHGLVHGQLDAKVARRQPRRRPGGGHEPPGTVRDVSDFVGGS